MDLIEVTRSPDGNEICSCGSFRINRYFRKKGDTWLRCQVQLTAVEDCVSNVCQDCGQAWVGKPLSGAKSSANENQSNYSMSVIMGQRKCSYPGQYAPEALDVQDEFGHDENPYWIGERLDFHRKTNDFDSVVVVTIRVPFAEVERALEPPVNKIDGAISLG